MKTKHVISAAALILVSSVASAGKYSPQELIFDMTNRTASGDMLTVRNSLNPLEFIGCGVRHLSGLTWGFCQAGISEVEGEFFTCYTEDPNLLEAIKALDDFSWITFRWDVDGNCAYIGNSTQSFYLPDFKAKTK
jgi:hypothetical protein